MRTIGRRGFIAALFAPLVAKWMPKAKEPQSYAEFRVLRQNALSLEEFRLKYVIPAMEKYAAASAHRMDLMFSGLMPFPEKYSEDQEEYAA